MLPRPRKTHEKGTKRKGSEENLVKRHRKSTSTAPEDAAGWGRSPGRYDGESEGNWIEKNSFGRTRRGRGASHEPMLGSDALYCTLPDQVVLT